MKLKIQKIQVKGLLAKHQKIHLTWRYFAYIISTAIALALIITLQFIYKNISESFKSTQEIIVLRSEVAPEVYDIEKFENVLRRLEEKTKRDDLIVWEKIKNPFGFLAEVSYPNPSKNQENSAEELPLAR